MIFEVYVNGKPVGRYPGMASAKASFDLWVASHPKAEIALLSLSPVVITREYHYTG